MKAIVEVARLQVDGGLQVGDGALGLRLKPIRDAEVVVRDRQARVELDGAFEVLDGLGAMLKHSEEETDFMLDAGRFGIERRGLLPFRERAHCIAAILQFDGFGFDLRRGLLAEKKERI